MKRRRVVYTPDAANDLDSLYDYIADTVGPAVAADYEERILRFCAGLGLGAERGSLRDDIRPGLRSSVSNGESLWPSPSKTIAS